MSLKKNTNGKQYDISIAFKKASHGTELEFETRDCAERIKCCSQFEENSIQIKSTKRQRWEEEKSSKPLQAADFIQKSLTVWNSENKKERRRFQVWDHKKTQMKIKNLTDDIIEIKRSTTVHQHYVSIQITGYHYENTTKRRKLNATWR